MAVIQKTVLLICRIKNPLFYNIKTGRITLKNSDFTDFIC